MGVTWNSIAGKTIIRMRLALCLTAPIMLGGCSGLIDLPGSEDAPQVYQLTAPAEIDGDFGETDWRILVDEPDASRSIDTDRIALRPSEVELSYYAKSKWADRAPRMIQDLMIQSLENANAVQYAGRGPSGMSAQYLVTGTLDSFHAEYTSGNPVVSVGLKLNLIDQRTGRILESAAFKSEIESDKDQVKAVVLAFNEATQSVMRDAASWTLAELNDR